MFRCFQADLFTCCLLFAYLLSVPSCGIVPFHENLFFDVGLRIYAKFYTIEELVAFSGMPSASSYG